MPIPESITCVDCGEPAYLIQAVRPDDSFQPGDVVSYRCSACLDRWDVELAEEDVAPDAEPDSERPTAQ